MKSCAKSIQGKRTTSAFNNENIKSPTPLLNLDSLSMGKASNHWKPLKKERRLKGADGQMNGKRALIVHFSSESSSDGDEFSSSIQKKSRVSIDKRASGDCHTDTIAMDTSNSKRSSQTNNTSKDEIVTISKHNFLNKVGSSSLSSQRKRVHLIGRNKRGRLPVLDSSDSGGESDLFDFGDAKLSHRSPKKIHSTRYVTNANEKSPDGESLCFPKSSKLEASGNICSLPKSKGVSQKMETKYWIDSRKRNTKVENSENEQINIPFKIQKLKNDDSYELEDGNVHSSARNFKLFTKNQPVLGQRACVAMIFVVVDPREGVR